MKKFISNNYIRYGIFIAAGMILGWLFFHPRNGRSEDHLLTEQTSNATIWTCAMHPQIRMDHPGKCPICGMDLIPLNQAEPGNIDPDEIRLTREAAELANVQTSVVTTEKPVKEVRLFGKVQADERAIQSQTAHLPGRIEKLLVNFTGETVRKGQPLAIIYSPDLVTAQQELLEAADMKASQPEIYEAVREKLRLWKLTDDQINEIETSGKVKDNFEIVSNTSGVILALRVNNGDHVDEGSVLFDVADLSDVWVMFDGYESDLPFINNGDRLTFTVQALPGKTFSGRITFIDPVIDPFTRVAKVRVEVNNSSGALKPEMFATGIIKADLNQYASEVVIPRSAVLWTGVRSIVYVKQSGKEEQGFKMREIELGPSLGNSFVVLKGLKEGEEIVTNGTFSIDASAQLAGKPSMMNPRGGKINTMPGMNMPESEMPQNKENGNADLNQQDQMSERAPDKVPATDFGNKISTDFVIQLSAVYDQYIKLKNTLADDALDESAQASEKMRDALRKADINLLSGDLRIKWMEAITTMDKLINTMISPSGPDSRLMAFSGLSNELYKTVKAFGLTGKTAYYQFCPMFNNGKGAYWLSESKEIRNPYFGSKMTDCGVTEETLNF